MVASYSQAEFVSSFNFSDQLFVSSGEYDEFVDFWLNGERLMDEEDCTKESGSTRITIRSQTFQTRAQEGYNTIAAEFRVDGDSSSDSDSSSSNQTGTTTDTANKTNQHTASFTDDSWVQDGTGWRCKVPDGFWLANTWHQLPYRGTMEWYHFNEVSDGAKGTSVTDTWVGDYYVDADGVWTE